MKRRKEISPHTADTEPCVRSLKIGITHFEKKGKGLIALESISKGETIEESPVFRISEKDESFFKGHAIDHQLFAWDPDGKTNDQAICLGMTTFVNHSRTPNCTVEFDYEREIIRLVALRDISVGEELGYDYDCALWFEEA